MKIVKIVLGIVLFVSVACGEDVKWVPDATASIQAALDKTGMVVIPYVGKDWIVDPLILRSNTILMLRPGVRIIARRGGFAGTGDCLLRLGAVNNVTISGYGAVLRGWGLEQTNPSKYKYSQWRHGLSITSSTNVTIKGLHIENFGGDGIYIGRSKGKPVCHTVLVKSVTCEGNYRNGLSIIAGNGIVVSDSTFTNTRGNNPQAGVCIEPNNFDDELTMVLLHNCRASVNNGPGFCVWLNQYSEKTLGTLIIFKDCHALGNRKITPIFSAPNGMGRGGLVMFDGCTFEDSDKPSPDKAVYKNCKWSQCIQKVE